MKWALVAIVVNVSGASEHQMGVFDTLQECRHERWLAYSNSTFAEKNASGLVMACRQIN